LWHLPPWYRQAQLVAWCAPLAWLGVRSVALLVRTVCLRVHCIQVVSTLLQLFVRPYDHRLQNALETASLVVLLTLCRCAFAFVHAPLCVRASICIRA
jgi:hypothetical protein